MRSHFERNLQRLSDRVLAIELRLLGPKKGYAPPSHHHPIPDVKALIIEGTPSQQLLNWLDGGSHRTLYCIERCRERLCAFLSSPHGTRALTHPRVWIGERAPQDVGLEVAVLGPCCSDVVLALGHQIRCQHEDPRLFCNHFLKNLSQLGSSLQATDLWGAFAGVPAVICGGGPSLDLDYDRSLLRYLKDRALLLAGGSALTVLTRSGMTPHFGGGIDPTITHAQRAWLAHAFEVPFFYRHRIHPLVLEQTHGPRLYVSGAAGYPIVEWADSELGLLPSGVQEGVSVSCFLLSVAAQLGCSPIILLGMDLCYKAGREYAASLDVPPASETNRLLFKDKSTTGQWILEAEWISRWARNREVYNATSGGLDIPGLGHELPDLPRLDVEGRVAAAMGHVRRCPDGTQVYATLYDSILRTKELLKRFNSSLDGVERLIAEVELADEVAYRLMPDHGLL